MPARRRLPWLLAVVALAAPASAAAAAGPVPVATRAEVARIASAGLAGVEDRRRGHGLFADQTGRTVGAGGLPSLAWAALRGQPDADALALAQATLAHGSGTTVVLRWPLAMLVADDPPGLPAALRSDLRGRVATWARLHAAGIADRCYARASCFNNYKVADAVLDLELVRSGVRSDAPGTRLHDPAALRRRTLAWLGRDLVRAAPTTATVRVPGAAPEPAALITDPGSMPLAYHALCTGWAVRALVLAGADAPPALRRLTRRALWALVGVAAPDGEVAWSGRGQDQGWSLAAALYAASAGSRLFAGTDPVLAARLRRLADVELAALAGRLGPDGLAVLPSGNGALSGLDHYYSAVGSTGLALTWLGLAADVLPDPTAPRLALPSEVPGATFADPSRSGLLARRVGGSWLGVRLRRATPFDPRGDVGLVRALRLGADGWHEERPARPGPVSRVGRPALRVPSGGPELVLGGRRYGPRTTAWRPLANGVQLDGSWREPAGRSLPVALRITATAAGAALGVGCPAGGALALTEWLPRRGALQRGARFVARAGYRITASAPLMARPLATAYANARQPSLAAVRVVVGCRTGHVTLRWTGGAAVAG